MYLMGMTEAFSWLIFSGKGYLTLRGLGILGGISFEELMMIKPQCGVNFQTLKLLWLKGNKISSQLGTIRNCY